MCLVVNNGGVYTLKPVNGTVVKLKQQTPVVTKLVITNIGPKGDKGDPGQAGTGGTQWNRYEADNEVVITHASLANTIEPILYINGTPNDIETNIIVQDEDNTTLTFPYPVSGIIRWKA